MTKNTDEKKYSWCDEEFWEKKFGKDFEERIEKKFEKWGSRNSRRCHGSSGMGGGFYFLAMIGVAVYYVQQVSGFWPSVGAILKAIVWPAFLFYEIFVRLGM